MDNRTDVDTAALFESRSTSSDFARRLKSLLTPPRSRRSPNDAGSDGCASSSGRLTQSRSCDNIGRLEVIFEPRMAPYTPPINLRRSEDSDSNSSIPQEKLEKLEHSLFEPRNSPCTPPLVRRRARSDPTSPTEPDRPAPTVSPLALRMTETSSMEDDTVPEAEATPKKLSVEQLQEILSDLRLRAKASSEECAKKVNMDSITVRQVEKIASVGPSENFQRSYSGRLARRAHIMNNDDLRSRSVTVC